MNTKEKDYGLMPFLLTLFSLVFIMLYILSNLRSFRILKVYWMVKEMITQAFKNKQGIIEHFTYNKDL